MLFCYLYRLYTLNLCKCLFWAGAQLFWIILISVTVYLWTATPHLGAHKGNITLKLKTFTKITCSALQASFQADMHLAIGSVSCVFFLCWACNWNLTATNAVGKCHLLWFICNPPITRTHFFSITRAITQTWDFSSMGASDWWSILTRTLSPFSLLTFKAFLALLRWFWGPRRKNTS